MLYLDFATNHILSTQLLGCGPVLCPYARAPIARIIMSN